MLRGKKVLEAAWFRSFFIKSVTGSQRLFSIHGSKINLWWSSHWWPHDGLSSALTMSYCTDGPTTSNDFLMDGEIFLGEKRLTRRRLQNEPVNFKKKKEITSSYPVHWNAPIGKCVSAHCNARSVNAKAFLDHSVAGAKSPKPSNKNTAKYSVHQRSTGTHYQWTVRTANMVGWPQEKMPLFF